MSRSVLNKKPSAFVLTINGEVVKDAGNQGVIASFTVADRLRTSLAQKNPGDDVALFGCFLFRGGK
jgi:hypothetical protein